MQLIHKTTKKHIAVILLFLIFSIIFRSTGISSLPDSLDPYDESGYLYDAKLINQGRVPYKDFFLAHPPLFIYLLSFFFKVTPNISYIHFANILILSSIVVFIYLISFQITKKNKVALLSSFLYTFSFLIFFYSKTLFIEPIISLLLISSLYLYFQKEKIATYLFIILSSIAPLAKIPAFLQNISLIIKNFFTRKRLFCKENKPVFVSIFISIAILLVLSFLVPNFYQDTIEFHRIRNYQMPFLEQKVPNVIGLAEKEWAIFLTGFIGCLYFIFKKTAKEQVKAISYICFISSTFFIGVFKVFCWHYLMPVLPLFCIISSLFITKLSEKIQKLKFKNNFISSVTKKYLVFLIIILYILLTYKHVSDIIEYQKKSSEIAKDIVENIRKAPGDTIYTAYPMFAVLAEKEVPFWYYANDTYAASQLDIPVEDSVEIFKKSDIIMFNYRTRSHLLKEAEEWVEENCDLIYKREDVELYLNKGK